MKIGTPIPARGPLANLEAMRRIAEEAERMGYGVLAVPDHILVPRRIDSTYPYTTDGAMPGADAGDSLEQFSILAWLAAVSQRAKLVTSVTVAPLRGAVHMAKIVSTIDLLSNGRVALGLGTGWLREEFEAVGAPPFENRGRSTDEYIEAMKILWTEDNPRYKGEFVDFDNIVFLPRPVQQPRPEIWIGGEGKPALRRVVKHGDVWYPIGLNPRQPLNTPARIRDGVARLHEVAEEHDRDPASIGLALFMNAFQEGEPIVADTGERQLLTGGASDLREDIDFLSSLGYGHLVLNFQRPSLEQTLASMQWFADEVGAR